MYCVKGSLREGAPDEVGWRSTRNNGLRTCNEIKIVMYATPSVNRIASGWLARVATSLRREALSNTCSTGNK